MQKKNLSVSFMVAFGMLFLAGQPLYIAQAHHGVPPVGVHHQLARQQAVSRTAGDTLEDLSLRFDVSNKNLEEQFVKGWNMADLSHGALLAFASGKSLNEVLSIKADENLPWSRIEYKIGLTVEEKQEAIDKSNARYIERKLDVDDDDALKLFAKGYPKADVLYAVIISKYCGKSAEELISMHEKEGDWNLVAEKSGVSSIKLDKIRDIAASIRLL